MRYELKVCQIILFIFGGVSETDEEEKITKDFRKEFKIAIAGPVTSFVVAAKLGCMWWVVFPHANTATVGNIVESTMAILRDG